MAGDPLGYDPTIRKPPVMPDPDFARQRQEWLARYVRENPGSYDYAAILEQLGQEEQVAEVEPEVEAEAEVEAPVGGAGTQFQSPAGRDKEFERILREYFRK